MADRQYEIYSELNGILKFRRNSMKSYQCSICGHIYNPEKGEPEQGIAAGTDFSDLPSDWTCPVCGASKDKFNPV
jgi:Rubredoxin